MKYILILSLFFGALLAKSSDACYSVQLTSFYLKKNSSYNFSNKNYPSSCILVNINGLRSVRCGCFEEYRDAENNLNKLANTYYDAIIVNTYKRRFSNVTSDSFNDSRDNSRNSSRRESYSSNYDNGMSERDYPTEQKHTEKRTDPTKAYNREDDYSQENYNKSFYEEEVPKKKRNFYGQFEEEEEEEDDLYESEESATKQTYSHDRASGNYRRSSRRDYSRSSNKW